MRYLLRMTVVILVSFSMTATAAACEPVAPKVIEGRIELSTSIGQSLAVNYFMQNECDWGANEEFNGSDGLILDVGGLGGTKGDMTARVGLGTFLVGLRGEFVDDSCAVIPGPEINQGTDTNTYTLDFPEGAKWFALTPTGTPYVTRDIFITVRSEGRECEEPAEEKKKKKKKKKARS